MGYFSNGTEGDKYEERYCNNCAREILIHKGEEHGCPIWFMHMMYNYEECNNKDSMLHKMIPIESNKHRSFCGKCNFFLEKQ
jgi:hypothetical protein